MQRKAEAALSACRLAEGASVTVHVDETGRTFRSGDLVDLEAVAAPARGDRPAFTWRDVLGEHVQHFAPLSNDTPTAEQMVAAAGQE